MLKLEKESEKEEVLDKKSFPSKKNSPVKQFSSDKKVSDMLIIDVYL